MSYFYPRPPRGGRLAEGDEIPFTKIFLPTPSARRATHLRQDSGQRKQISTHALREEGDGFEHSGPPCRADFYPRPPRGGRQSSRPLQRLLRLFLPTPSARRATAQKKVIALPVEFLPTPSARRATKYRHVRPRADFISTHALREEGDGRGTFADPSAIIFLPTPSARRATSGGSYPGLQSSISTHALREEGDVML